MTTPSIDPHSIAAWDRSPNVAFAAFVASPDFVMTSSRQPEVPRPVSAESAAVYTFMFGKFAGWMVSEKLKMTTVNAADLQRFIALASDGKRDLNSKIAYRYLRLLERCFDYLERSPNPARQAIALTDRAQIAKDAPMTALTAEELQRFLAALPAGPGDRNEGAGAWKRRRDRAMQVTMALAGLRVAEAIGLLVGEVGRQPDLEGGVALNITPESKHPTSHEHTTTLPREGVAELRAWLAERAALKIPGELAFPANLDGDPLHKATVYRQVRASFERAGIAIARAGGRTLRNTFANQQLRQGTSQGELTGVLGLALERSAAAYKYARTNPEDEPGAEPDDDSDVERHSTPGGEPGDGDAAG
ncbi:tyrosine-type recombinase/integrase [Massilia sp. 9096]|uniref:tyrosine-type recombinase/integrase n=1 Tax=Massilia sp. 9096 TaxID=1500894 RepID=UPI000690386A|nr:tyrosine-type recombinase/integrase [Massilia sp. 9096]